jgi:hypothetical protein
MNFSLHVEGTHRTRHIGRMIKKSTAPRYRIIPQKDLTYGVEVDTGTGMPTTITGLSTEMEARDWIVAHENAQMLEKMQNLGVITKRKPVRRRG